MFTVRGECQQREVSVNSEEGSVNSEEVSVHSERLVSTARGEC